MSNYMKKLSDDWGIIVDEIEDRPIQIIPSPSPSLNWATGIGGFQHGKISVLYGPESAGKSLLAMYAIVELQKKDKDAIALWFDTEFSFNINLFKKIGGDTKRLRLKRTNDPVKIFDFIGSEVLEKLQEGLPLKCIVIDSIKAIRYPKEMNKKLTTDQHMGGAGSQYLGGALKLIVPIIAEYNLLTFFVQQVTMEIDPMKALRNPFVVTEGKALKHASDIMLEIVKLDTKAGVIESGETISGAAQQTGHKVRIKVKKNRLGVPARMAQFTWHYDKGVIDTDIETFELGKSLGVIFHPKNPDTGKENVQMWQFGSYDPIRGEANMLQFVKGSRAVQKEILDACNNHVDVGVEVDADGVVINSIDEHDLNVEL